MMTTSGRTPSHCEARSLPVRPNPTKKTKQMNSQFVTSGLLIWEVQTLWKNKTK
jgi:hypothetical protein